MFGAIIGDTSGSIFEFNNYKGKDISILSPRCHLTDDSYLTLAVVKTLLENKDDLSNLEKIKQDTIQNFIEYFKAYPYAGYGHSFYYWCYRPSHSPYNSFGNGAGMRISPVGWIANSEEEVKALSDAITGVTHNHPEGLKGAECIAMCIYHLLHGKDKEFIKNLVINDYYPHLKDLDYDDLVANYTFDVTCQGSVAEAIYCFLISNDFEDCIRTSISIGGDSDTIACMSCALAEAYYKVPSDILRRIKTFMQEEDLDMLNEFDKLIKYDKRSIK